MPPRRYEASYSTPKKKKKPPLSPVAGPTTAERTEASRTAPKPKKKESPGWSEYTGKTPGDIRRAATSQTVVSTEERAAASKSTRKSATKKDRKQTKRKLGIVQAYRGTKEPETKAERRAAAKGAQIEKILLGSSTKDPSAYTQTAPYVSKRAATPILRAQRITDLKRERHDYNKQLDKLASGKSEYESTGVASAKRKDLLSKLNNTKLLISELQGEQLKQNERILKKNKDKLIEYKGKEGVDKAAVQKEIQKNNAQLKAVRDEQKKIEGKEILNRVTAKKATRQYQKLFNTAEEGLESAVDDPTPLSEFGFRIRDAEGDASKAKFPGMPTWTKFDPAEPSGALEDAMDMAQWMPVGGAALRGIGLAARGTKAGLAVAKGGKLLSNVVKVPGKTVAGKAAKTILPRIPNPVKLAAANVAAKSAITKGTPKVLKAVKNQPQTLPTKAGSVIQRSAPVDGVHAERASSMVASAVDQAIMASARTVASTIPRGVGWKAAAGGAGRKLGKGGAFVGGIALGPQLVQGESLEDSALNIARDAHDLVVGVVPSVWQAGAAGYEALHGDFDKAEQMADEFMEYSFIGLAIQGRWDEALVAYNERPLTSALEISGAEYVLGRSIGAAARVSPSAKLRQAASVGVSTRLGPLDTKASSIDRYSPDVFRKGFKVGAGAVAERVAPKATQRARDAETQRKVFRRVDAETGTKQAETLRMLDANFREHKDFYKRANDIADEAGPDMLPFMITRIARNPETAFDDLTAYRAKLVRRYESRKGSKNPDVVDGQALTGETIRVLDEILAHPDALRDQRMWDIADEFAIKEDARQEAMLSISTLNKNQSRAASWIPYIIQHMGGKPTADGWKIDIQMRNAKGQFVRKKLDLTNPAHLDLVEKHAGANNVAPPSFFRLQGLNEVLVPTAARFNGRAARFHARTQKAIELGTFDPTFNALYSHSARVGHTVLDGETAIRMATEWSPFREFGDGGTMYHVAPSRFRDAIEKEGLSPVADRRNKESGHEEGVYLWKTREGAVRYMTTGKNQFGDMDIWKVEGDGLELIRDTWLADKYPDRLDDFGEAVFTPGGVGPERISGEWLNQWNVPTDSPGPGSFPETTAGTRVILGTKKQIERRLEEAGIRDDYIAFDLEAYKIRLAASRGLGEEIGTQGARFDDSTSGATGDALKAATESDKSGERFVAMPKAVVERLNAHAKVDDNFYRTKVGQIARRGNRAFKGAVLPFNPHWGLGNAMDMTFRMMMDQSGGPPEWIVNRIRGGRWLNKLKRQNETAYWEVMEGIGHGFMTESMQGIMVDKFLAMSTKQELVEKYRIQQQMIGWQSNPAAKANVLTRAKMISNGLGSYFGAAYRFAQEYNPAGFRLQAAIEKNVRIAAAGKHIPKVINDIQKQWDEAILITPKVIEDTTRMLENTDAQNALFDRVNGVLGDYSRMSPQMRAAVYSYAPFALWLRASVNWVMTLPAKHPAQTAILASLNTISEDERAALGLSVLNRVEEGREAGESGATPTVDPYMLGSIPVAGGLYPTQTLTSFGTFNEFGATTGTRFLLPQISSSIFMIGSGLDWKGEKLIYPDGREVDNPWERTGMALSNLTETFFPAARWYKIFQAEGSPDETATWWNPKPQGKRDTFISQFPGAASFEQPERNPFMQIFNPAKIIPTEAPESQELPPAPYGSAAQSAGERTRETEEATSSGTGWLFGGEEPETSPGFFDEPTTEEAPAPNKGWLFGS